MAFPSIVGRATHVSATANAVSYDTSSAVLPGAPGDLLVAIVSSDGNPTLIAQLPPVGTAWSKLGQASNGSIVTGAVYWKVAESVTWGSAADRLIVSSSASEQFSSILLRIAGATLAIEGTSANGSSTNSNPSAVTLAGAVARDVLWIATRSGDSTVVATTAPAGYANLQSRASGGTAGASTNTAERLLNAASEDPAAFTSASEQWVSWTLAIYEAALVPLYIGAGGKALAYLGARSDPQLYKGPGQLWP